MGKPIPFPGGGKGIPGSSPVDLSGPAVSRIARICALGLGLEELLHEVCREVRGLLGADACLLAAWGPDDGTARVWGASPDGPGPRLAPAFDPGTARESLASRLRDGGVLAIADLAVLPPDDPARTLFEDRGARAILLAPLSFGSSLLGVLAVAAVDGLRDWSPGDTALASEVAPILAAALERRRMEERLRASEARYRFLADNARDVISLHDPAGRFLYANPASSRVLGYRPGELTGAPLDAYLHPDDAAAVLEGNRRLAAGEVQAVTLPHRIRRKDGGYAEVETVASAVTDGRGRVRQILRVARDVTERKRMERILHESQRQETIGMLAGGMAHEFNNILAGIGGAVEMLGLLLSGNEETATFLDMIGRLSNRATVLSRQLLTYARQGAHAPETVQLNRVVGEDLPVLRTALPGGVDVRLDLAPELPPIAADVTRLKQVVTALCLNAAEAMQDGGVLTIRTRREEPGEPGAAQAQRTVGAVAGSRAVLEVEDTGSGMDGPTIERIFEPFFTTKFIGRGMGLAAVRGIVESHGGMIRVRSAPGRGTTFTLAFPAAEAKGREGEARESLPPCGSGVILVADDEDDVRTVLRAMLESFGYRVIEARDGREAVGTFRERAGEIDLVLLDLMMPGMTGEEAYAEIRRIAPGAPAILASGYDQSGRIGEIVAAGFEAFLQKPFRRRELGRKVADVLAKRPRGPSRTGREAPRHEA